MTTEWDNTPWAGSVPDSRALVPVKTQVSLKAVTDIGSTYANGTPLSSWSDTPQKRAAAYLKAYKCGWFYKAESKISGDFASLGWNVSDGDAEEGDREAQIDAPPLSVPWERLSVIEQFMRLMERPNPNQTGRQLKQKTQIRRDMAGTAFWYLDGLDGGFLPRAIYGISPARMWPSYDRDGNLIGWVMDRDAPSGGVPFSKDEIIAFPYATSDDQDIFGVGVVEAVTADLPIGDLIARHTTDLLTTGGRLAGMLWPKDRGLDESEFLDAQRAWRNVASDPNAARRLLLFPEPMEWTQGASTPKEIGIPELAALNRETILTAFPISPYMLGVPMAGGLNESGASRQEEKATYWEGTIHPRVASFDEVIAVHLISRYETVTGRPYRFETEEPNLDDAASLTAKAKAITALTDIGFDETEAVAAVGLDHIKFNGLPAPEPPPDIPAPIVVSAPKQLPPRASKAAVSDRDKVMDIAVPVANKRLAEFFAEQRERLIANITADLRRANKSQRAEAFKARSWWDEEAEDGALQGAMSIIYRAVGRGGLQSVADTLNRTIKGKQVDPIVADLLRYGGRRIKDINERTLASLVDVLAEGTRRGYSVTQLIEGVPDEGFTGVKGVTLDNGTPVFSDARAETIARTETALSYNRATVTGYESFGIKYLLAYDGDQDEECAARDGNEFPIEEALDIEDHPNGTLVWSPVVDKAEHTETNVVLEAIKALTEVLASRPTEYHIHNAQPDVTVEPTVVNVPPPVVNVNVPEAKPVKRTIERDQDGRISGVTEG